MRDLLNFDASGYWWFPGNPDDDTYGRLIVSQENGLTLQLEGTLTAVDQQNRPAVVHPVIHGIADRKLFTLLDVRSLGTSLAMPGYAAERLRPRYALVGVHVPDPAALAFRVWSLEFEDLPQWWGEWGAQTSHRLESGRMVEVGFAYRQPSATELSLGDLGRATIHPGGAIRFSDDHFTAHQSAYLSIELPAPLEIAEALVRVFHPVQDFLSLACDYPNGLVSVKARVNPEEAEALGGDRRDPSIPIIHDPRIPVGPDDQRPTLATRTILPASLLRSRTDLLERWIGLQDRYRSMFNLYFGTRYITAGLQENTFLNLVHAFEGIHRRKFPAAEKEGDIRERVAIVLAEVNADDRDWLEDQLQYAHEPNLRARIRALLDTLPPRLIGPLTGHRGRFVHRVVVSRHYLTHWDPTQEKNHPSPNLLFRLNETLGALLKLLLLREIGLTDSELEGAVQGHFRFARLVQLNSNRRWSN